MYLFNKFFHPLNFVFGTRYTKGSLGIGNRRVSMTVEGSKNDVYRVTFGVNADAPQSPAPLAPASIGPF